jgi:hypothetical protein
MPLDAPSSTAQLTISGVKVQAPVQASDPNAVFTELGAQFSVDEKVIKFLLDEVGVKTLRDFATLFSSAEDIKAMVELVPDLEPLKRILQVARLRQAWEGVEEAQRTAEGHKKIKGDDPDLDLMLPQTDLDDLTECFWRRYHLNFDSEVMPADALLSRCSRELQRRLLTVRDVWKVQTLSKELKGEKRTTDLSDGLALVQEAAQPVEKNERCLQKYLDLLWTLLLAYGKAGCKMREDAPSDGEPFGSSSIHYVHVPLDVLMAYHRRAQSFALKLPPSQALSVLTARDEAERKAWVDKFRQSRDTLGEVIAATFDKRAGVWIVTPEADESRPSARADFDRPRREAPAQNPGFCANWNAGGCVREGPCPQGLKHRCSVIRPNGSPCNIGGHRAINCNLRNEGGKGQGAKGGKGVKRRR